jgi:hypothetical protein
MPDTTPGTTPSSSDAHGLRPLARMRARLAEALARRACAHAGEVRRVLDAKLAAMQERFNTSSATPQGDVQRPSGAAHPPRGPLADLVDHVARQKAASGPLAPAASRAATTSRPEPGTAADPKTLQFFQRTWSRLSADQRLEQSRASLPDNAGPLNSHHLVHRSLTLMRELSPDYLERFVGYVDALQWLEQANEAAAQEAASRPAVRRSMPARRG